jgi:hypothetical protein
MFCAESDGSEREDTNNIAMTAARLFKLPPGEMTSIKTIE